MRPIIWLLVLMAMSGVAGAQDAPKKPEKVAKLPVLELKSPLDPKSSRRPPAIYAELDFRLDRSYDPLESNGGGLLSSGSASGSAAVVGRYWYIRSLFDRRLGAVTGFDAGADADFQFKKVGPLRLGLGLQYRYSEFESQTFKSPGFAIATARKAQSASPIVSLSLGRMDRRNFRLDLMYGFYESVYWSVLYHNGFSGRDPVFRDGDQFAGARMAAADLPVGRRVLLGGELGVRRPIRKTSPAVAGNELYGLVSADMRLLSRLDGYWYLGYVVSWGTSAPIGLPDRSLTLRISYRTR